MRLFIRGAPTAEPPVAGWPLNTVEGSDALVDCSNALAAAYTHGGESVLSADAMEFIKRLDRNDGAGGTDRMSQSHRAPIGVGFLQVKFEILGYRTRLCRECFIGFNYVHVAVYEDGAGKVFYRVHLSKSETLAEAEKMEKRLEGMGFPDAFIIRM